MGAAEVARRLRLAEERCERLTSELQAERSKPGKMKTIGWITEQIRVSDVMLVGEVENMRKELARLEEAYRTALLRRAHEHVGTIQDEGEAQRRALSALGV